MKIIQSTSTDPHFNLAAEEYLFRNLQEDIFFLYVNAPSVVVGKHQNALAEVNPQFIFENNIPVIRRLSGGGAVYHDFGNLNFSFHQTVADPAKISFKIFNIPIVEVLLQLGVPAEISSRNDIFVTDFKVSGHAEHVFRNRILSHGTLLFDAEKENLSKALKNNSGKFTGKAIASVRSKVANVVDFLASPISVDLMIELIQQHLFNSFENCSRYTLSDFDIVQIQKLVDEKYSTWEWNFGYSPKYRFEKEILIDEQYPFSVCLNVEKGIIVELEVVSDVLSAEKIKAVQTNLLNSPHEFHHVIRVLQTLELDPLLLMQLIQCFF